MKYQILFLFFQIDLCQCIRNFMNHKKVNIKDDEPLPENYFAEFTDINEIENLLFGNILEDYEYFVIRLYVVKQELKTMGQKLKGFLAKFVTDIGLSHIAVQINDKMVHWFDVGLVIVTPFEGSNASAVFYPQKDGDEIPCIENTEENRKKICEVILEYNCNKKYNQKNDNCQNFVEDIFDALKLDSDFKKMKGHVGDYLKFITGKGKNEKYFACIVDSKQNILMDKKKKLVFKTHEELDEWTVNNLEKCKKKFAFFNSLFYKNEKMLLFNH